MIWTRLTCTCSTHQTFQLNLPQIRLQQLHLPLAPQGAKGLQQTLPPPMVDNCYATEIPTDDLVNTQHKGMGTR